MLYTPEHAPRLLTEEQEEQVHTYAMRILEEIGLDVLHEGARQLLEKAGQKVEGERVYFDRGIEMERIVHGGDLGDRTALMGVVNSVSPLIWDFRMVDAMIAWADSNQATVVTPFLLGGATAAVSVAGGLAQQVAEALSGVALA